MKFEKVTLPAMIVIGTELRTTWKNGECHSDIPDFWQHVHSTHLLDKIANKENKDTIFGLYTNYSSDFSLSSGLFSLVIGSPVTSKDEIPRGMIAVEIPETKYAVFTAQGQFAQAIPRVWSEIWQNKDMERAFTHDFEWYNALSTDDDNSIVNMYVSIK